MYNIYSLLSNLYIHGWYVYGLISHIRVWHGKNKVVSAWCDNIHTGRWKCHAVHVMAKGYKYTIREFTDWKYSTSRVENASLIYLCSIYKVYYTVRYRVCVCVMRSSFHLISSYSYSVGNGRRASLAAIRRNSVTHRGSRRSWRLPLTLQRFLHIRATLVHRCPNQLFLLFLSALVKWTFQSQLLLIQYVETSSKDLLCTLQFYRHFYVHLMETCKSQPSLSLYFCCTCKEEEYIFYPIPTFKFTCLNIFMFNLLLCVMCFLFN